MRLVVVSQTLAVDMADDRSALFAARPVLAGLVVAGGKCGTIGLGPGQRVMPVRLVAAAVDDFALFAECGLLGQIVRAMQLGDILGDDRALGILPRPLADAVAGVDRGLAARRL